MIIQNGYIQLKEQGRAVYNPETGVFEQSDKTSWIEGNIPCQWRALSADLLARSGANAKSSFQYEVLIELDVAMAKGIDEHYVESSSNEQFRLFDLKNNLKGEFSSKSIAHYELVNIAKILTE